MNWLLCYISPEKKSMGKIFGCVFLLFTTLLPHFTICNYWVAYNILLSVQIGVCTQAKIIPLFLPKSLPFFSASQMYVRDPRNHLVTSPQYWAIPNSCLSNICLDFFRQGILGSDSCPFFILETTQMNLIPFTLIV